jgi:hypothetical protein
MTFGGIRVELLVRGIISSMQKTFMLPCMTTLDVDVSIIVPAMDERITPEEQIELFIGLNSSIMDWKDWKQQSRGIASNKH